MAKLVWIISNDSLHFYETSAAKIKPHGSIQCQYRWGVHGGSGSDHFHVPSKHSGQIITDLAIDTLTLTRLQPGHFNAMTRRMYSVFLSHMTWFRLLWPVPLSRMCSPVSLFSSPVRSGYLTPVFPYLCPSLLTWVLQFART